MTDRNDTPAASDGEAQSLKTAFGALRRQFMDAHARLWQIEALLTATASLECLQSVVTDDLVTISNLMDLGRDIAKLGDGEGDAFVDALDGFGNRLFREPVAGDEMPLEALVEMLEIAAINEPTSDNESMGRRVEMANVLKGYMAASVGTEMGATLGAALDAWLKMLDRQGANLKLVPWASGYEQYRYSWKAGFGPKPQRR